MKKTRIIVIAALLAALLLTGCASPAADDYIGLNINELGSDALMLNGYGFFTSGGKDVVVYYDSGSTVLEAKVYDHLSAPKEAFDGIKAGMSVYDVVELVGLPFRSVSFGLCTLDFKAKDGTVYRVGWSTLPEMRVTEVTKL